MRPGAIITSIAIGLIGGGMLGDLVGISIRSDNLPILVIMGAGVGLIVGLAIGLIVGRQDKP